MGGKNWKSSIVENQRAEGLSEVLLLRVPRGLIITFELGTLNGQHC